MPSIVEGYNYDIFISYRQKDNKGDRWVSEFVEALKTELESTFKEEISVYFDINPHDGLLETHDVDASLKDKLKCLVFIPIVSRTYCDPKSFAWEHEFRAFVEQASKDQFGLKAKLPNGNVASRVLPVQIHDLDVADINECETVLGGVLRGIDFIYKAPGVNRPLRAAEDHPQDNLNKTYYRDQINKVANAIKELIAALGKADEKPDEIANEASKPLSGSRGKARMPFIAGSFMGLVLIVLGILFLPKLFKSKEQLEKSIAVLPFFNDSPDEANAYFINGIMDEVLNNLQKINDLRVLSRTSTDQYRGATRPTIPQISKKLGVNYIVEGSGQKYGNKFVLRVQLLEGSEDRHLWAESYEQEIDGVEDIIKIQSRIAKAIAGELHAIITPAENQLIEKTPTVNLTAYDFYRRGRDEYSKYTSDNREALKKAEYLYNQALNNDSAFALAYIGLAEVYWDRHYWSEYFTENFLDSVLILADIALSFDDDLSDAYSLRGHYYRQIGNSEQALKEYNKAIKLNPNDWQAYWGKGLLYRNNDFVNYIDNLRKAAFLNHGEELPGILRGLWWAYSSVGFFDESVHYIREALKLDGDSMTYYYYLSGIETYRDNFDNSIEFLKKAYAIDTNDIDILNEFGFAYLFSGQYDKALPYYKKWYERLKAAGRYDINDMHRIGYAYWQNGLKEEAEYYFNEQVNYGNRLIELGRAGAHLYYDMAGVYAFRGETDKAYENLRIFNQKQTMPSFMYWLIKHDPLFNGIRDEPEFQQIARDVEAKYQAEHDRVGKWLKEQGLL